MITAFCCNGMQLVVWKIRECTTRGSECVIKHIVRIIHLIDTEYGFQTAFVKSFIMGNEWQAFNQWYDLCPYFGKDRSIVGILLAQAMNLATPIIIVVWRRLDE